MHTIEQIINNQKQFKDNILRYFRGQISEAKEDLRAINTKDEYILTQKKKLSEKFKKTKFSDYNRLFFMHKKRNEHYYVWWDINLEEANILLYEQK